MHVLMCSLLVLLHQLWLYRRSGRFDPLAPTSLLDGVLIVLLVVGSATSPLVLELAASDVAFAWMWPLGQLALYLGYHMSLGKGQPVEHRVPPAWSLWASLAGYLGISFLTAHLITSAAGISIADWMVGSRAVARDIPQVTAFLALMSVVTMAFQVGVLVWLHQALVSRQWAKAALLYVALFLGIFLIFTTRFQVVLILALPAFWYHHHVRNLRPLAFVTIGIAVMVTLAALNIWRGGGAARVVTDLTLDTVVELSNVLDTGYSTEPAAVLFEAVDRGDLELEYGLNYATAFLTFIPRFLWPEKPPTAFENRMTEKLVGGQRAVEGHLEIWTFTAWGEGYMQFGVAGVVLNLFLFGWIAGASVRYCWARPHLYLVGVYFAVLSSVYLRAGFQALMFLAINMVIVAWMLGRMPELRVRVRIPGAAR